MYVHQVALSSRVLRAAEKGTQIYVSLLMNDPQSGPSASGTTGLHWWGGFCLKRVTEMLKIH